MVSVAILKASVNIRKRNNGNEGLKGKNAASSVGGVLMINPEKYFELK